MALKILSIDDELDMKDLIQQKFRRKIRKNEFEFLFAHNGVEAIEIMEHNEDINIILADINMPKMNGLEFLRELAKLKRPLVHVVMVSAYGDMKNLRLAMNLGAFDFINKPIDFMDMETTIFKAKDKIDLIVEQQKEMLRLITIENEIKSASAIQKAILPEINDVFRDYNSIKISTFIKPALLVGGDLYNVYALDDKRIGFLIADVSGKGIIAATFMLMSHTALSIFAHQGLKANEVLMNVNSYLEQDNESSMFTTTFYGVLDVETGDFEYSNGGHNPPYLFRNGESKALETTNNLALGIMPNLDYGLKNIKLSEGDFVMMYTDGVSEAQDSNNEEYGEDRMAKLIISQGDSAPQMINQNLYASIKEFCGDTEQFDDITMLSFRWK